MAMSECKSFDDYKAKFTANQAIMGFGLDVGMSVPSPFCAEPHFIDHLIVDTRQAYQAGAVCKSCGRGARGIFSDLPGGGVQCEFLQTRGAEPAPRLPRMRRVKDPSLSAVKFPSRPGGSK